MKTNDRLYLLQLELAKSKERVNQNYFKSINNRFRWPQRQILGFLLSLELFSKTVGLCQLGIIWPMAPNNQLVRCMCLV